MPSLPLLLSARDLPRPELCAARLDGELIAVSDFYSPIDIQEAAELRALTLATVMPERLIAEQRTAAWIWGAQAFPPAIPQFCSLLERRFRPPLGLRLAVREVVIDDTEWVSLAGIRVTTPPRTVVDLARFDPDFSAGADDAVVALLDLAQLTIEDTIEVLRSRSRLPRKRLAIERLEALRSPGVRYPALTR